MSLGLGVLQSGEEVRWSGRPARQAPIDWIDVAVFLFLGYVVGFAVVWPSLTSMTSLLICIPVVLFLARKRSTTVSYVITNRRVLTQSGKGIDAIPLAHLPPATVIQQRSDGVGTISFGPPSLVAHAVAVVFRGPGATHRRMQLVQVADAADVVSLIHATRSST